ncbi:MAG: M23 family metallopeptidase [Caldilineaceae bacterium]|nr:M23 family metallopeptidase [Caldilineaceae bacterium]
MRSHRPQQAPQFFSKSRMPGAALLCLSAWLLFMLWPAPLLSVSAGLQPLSQSAASPLLLPTPTPSPLPPAPDGYLRVKPDDTLLTLAVEFGLDLADAYCLATPDFDPTSPLVIGDLLLRLPDDQQCHAVETGETLAGIAALYATTPAHLRGIAWNELPAGLSDIMVLPGGGYLRVPRPAEPGPDEADGDSLLPMILRQPVGTTGEQLASLDAALAAQGALPVGGANRPDALLVPVPADWPYGSGSFVWPLYGWLTQDYHAGHRAIDVAARPGTLVTAADRGRVIRAGWSDQGYGNLVIIDHNIDYVTVYAHLSEVLVKEGDIVALGAPIGRVGSTGNSTGPHLHFEIRDFGRRVDPVGVLMR